MRRVLMVLTILVIVMLPACWFAWPYLADRDKPILVGILHSTTGTMKVNEASLVLAEKLAIQEINESGGLLGRPVKAIEVDGQSDPDIYAIEAEKLIRNEQVSVIFGCYSSASRKSVKPVVERHDHLLFYPVAYEGLEQSPNIIYTGGAPNQQVIPAVSWCIQVLKARSFFLIGNDFVWPRACNAIIKDQLKATGATVRGEEYVPLGSTDLGAVVAKVVAAKPDVILSFLIGESNLPFYERLRKSDTRAIGIPIVSFIVSEDELRGLFPQEMTNDYSVCNYFQSIARPENELFVKAYKNAYGRDKVTDDAIVTAYNSVKLWAQAVREAESETPRLVRNAVVRQSLDAPEGVISVDRQTQHTWRPFFVGKVRPDGQYDIVFTLSKPIRPVPYPFSRDRSLWEKLLEDLSSGWGGKWQAPAAPAGRRTLLDAPPGAPVTEFRERNRLSRTAIHRTVR